MGQLKNTLTTQKYTRYMAEILSGFCWHPYVQDFKKKKAFPNVHVCMCVFITVDMFNKPVLMPAFCGTDLMVQFDLALCMEC